jgi:hypothetical protein
MDMELQKNKDGKYTVWAFYYNPMTEESAYGIESLHLTKEGANKSMEIHREFARKEHEEYVASLTGRGRKTHSPFGRFEDWCIDEIEIKP